MSKLHVDSVRKFYGNNLILSDVFLSCAKGEIKGLVGRNGSGKSTLLKIIFGVERAEYSFVKVDTKVIKTVTDAKNLINYLPQENFLPNRIKIKKLIRLFLEKPQQREILKNEHIQPLLDKTNEVLSGGEKRIVEIALILYSKAQFILLDEPFNGVSPIVRNQIMDFLREMKKKKGIVLTDHDYRNVIKISDNILFLEDGYLQEIQSPEQLTELGYLRS
ncbi:ATP-binding cassette domain-containing protein [Tenacibaculum sp. 190524A05c]|uniref:ABC-type multidrug transport system ATPase subunit n=1 Tax=Tenacibaculum platacis TaxID=3137852 RepID=A0ABM9NXE1_9FLAO